MRIVQGLIAQLSGELQIEARAPGAHFRVRLPKDAPRDLARNLPPDLTPSDLIERCRRPDDPRETTLTRIATWTASHAGSAALRGDSAAILAPLCGLLYYLTASLDLALRGPDAAPVLSPQHGVLLALLMVTPYERWWALGAAVVPAHLLACWSTGLPAAGSSAGRRSSVSALPPVSPRRCDCCSDQRNPFDSLQDFLLYVLTAVIAGPAVLTVFAPHVTLAGSPAIAIWPSPTGKPAPSPAALAILTWSSWIYLALLPGPAGCNSGPRSNTPRR